MNYKVNTRGLVKCSVLFTKDTSKSRVVEQIVLWGSAGLWKCRVRVILGEDLGFSGRPIRNKPGRDPFVKSPDFLFHFTLDVTATTYINKLVIRANVTATSSISAMSNRLLGFFSTSMHILLYKLRSLIAFIHTKRPVSDFCKNNCIAITHIH